MPEQIQKILDKVLEWWKKFNNRQRVLILSSIGVVLIALVILGVVMSTPNMQVLYVCESYTEAAKIKEILDADGTITYETNSDGLIFSVSADGIHTASWMPSVFFNDSDNPVSHPPPKFLLKANLNKC